MLHHKSFVVNPVGDNCFVLWDDATRECALVDCGAWSSREREEISDFIRAEGMVPKYLLQTHMHFDHCLGLGYMAEQYGLTPLCHALDLPIYHTAPAMVLRWFRQDISGTLPEVSTTISEDIRLNLGEAQIQVLHTPGHTPGGVCYYIPSARMVLTGDTLFRGSIGRTDLPGGDIGQEVDSIQQKLFTLPPDTAVLPGHGPNSTIGDEMASNLYLM